MPLWSARLGSWWPDALVMRARLLSWLMRPTPPSVSSGLAVGALLLAVETVVVVSLAGIGGQSFGTVYVLGVLVVSAVWGLGLTVTMSVVSAVAYAYFRHWPHAASHPLTAEFWLSIAIFLVVALSTNAFAGQAKVGQRFFSLSSDSMSIGDLHRVIRANAALQQVIGYSEEEISSRPWLDFVVPEERERLRAVFDELPSRNEPTRFAARLICRDGSHRSIEWSAVWHRGLFYVVGRDLTDRHAREQDLRRAHAALEASRDELSVLAEQQKALRRVATLVASGFNQEQVFSAVSEEMVRCLDVDSSEVFRYEPDATATVVGCCSKLEGAYFLVGERLTLEGDSAAAGVLSTGRPAGRDNVDGTPGSLSARLRAMGIRSGVGAPILIDGRVWGVAVVGSSRPEPLPSDTQERIADFADLVATAVANAATRTELQASRNALSMLAEQQAGLRRVATLVARGVPPSDVFAAVADEMVRCLHAKDAGLLRCETGEAVLVAASRARRSVQRFPVGHRVPLNGQNIAAAVLRAGRAARVEALDNAAGLTAARASESGTHTGVGIPVLVGGQLWGIAYAGWPANEPMPENIEARMADFAELVSTAIANAATRDDLQASRDESHALAEQQAALRGVATLVARAVSPSQVFSAVAEEMVRCLDSDGAAVFRYEADGSASVIASSSRAGSQYFPVAERMPLDGDNLLAWILETGRPARHDDLQGARGPVVARVRELGIRSGVGAPIVVDGRVWGAVSVASSQQELLPRDTEERVSDFADLVAMAIVNAATRADLIASRARIVAATDDARRRIERDLHDGAQQRLVSVGLRLRMAEAAVPAELRELKAELSDIVSALTGVSQELQDISRGIHPAILSDGGLAPALKTLARRLPVPVSLNLAIRRRLPDSVEVAAYYVVAEALTNVVKHAEASEATVHAHVEDDAVHLSISDDGIGGADSRKGSGLVGLKDRVEAAGGRMKVTSCPGSGTALHVVIPLEHSSPADQ